MSTFGEQRSECLRSHNANDNIVGAKGAAYCSWIKERSEGLGMTGKDGIPTPHFCPNT